MMDDERSGDDEAQIHAAIHGSTPPGKAPDALGAHLRSICDELCQPPTAQARWNHLAAMRRARPVPRARGSVRTVAAIAAATVGLVAVTTGLAAAGRLPGAAQDQVAKLAEIVGVDLPGNDHAPGGSSSTLTPTDTDRPIARTGPDAGAEPTKGATVSNPGAAGTSPGGSGSAPGQSGGAPEQSRSAVGESGSTPESPGTTPDRSGATPAGPGTPPGQSDEAPGQSGTAPGRTASAPGRSGTAPGQSLATPGRSGTAPGQIHATRQLAEAAGTHSDPGQGLVPVTRGVGGSQEPNQGTACAAMSSPGGSAAALE